MLYGAFGKGRGGAGAGAEGRCREEEDEEEEGGRDAETGGGAAGFYRTLRKI